MLADTDDNKKTLSILTYELMNELEPYFRISKIQKLPVLIPPVEPEEPPVEPPAVIEPPVIVYQEVGDEAAYTVAQKSLLADLVAIQALFILAAGGSLGEETGGEEGGATLPEGTYLKMAKAGSVQVEFGKDAGSSTAAGEEASSDILQGTSALMSRLKQAAIRKGHNMGLIIDINGDSPLSVNIARTPPFPPFYVSPFSE